MTVRALSHRLPQGSTRLLWNLVVVVLAVALGSSIAIAPGVTVIAIAAIIAGIAVVARPDTATPLTIGLIYSNAFVVAAQFHGAPYLLPALLPAALLLPIGYRLFVRRQPVVVTPALPLLGLYLVVQLLAALASREPAASVEELSLYVSQGLLLYIAVTNALANTELIRAAVWTVLLAGSAMAGLSVFQQVTNTFDNEYFGFAQTGGRRLVFETAQPTDGTAHLQARASGPIGEKNRYAQVLIVLIPLGLFRFWGERSTPLKLLAAGTTTIISFGVLLTFSRGAAIGFVALVLALAFFRYVTVRQLLLACLALFALGIAMPTYVERLMSLEGIEGATAGAGEVETDPVLQQRANDVLAAGLAFVENPILGIGPGRFASVYRDYAPRVGGIAGEGDFAAHSLFPGIAAETGVLGLTVFSAILFVTIRELARARALMARVRPDLASLVTGFLLAIIVYLGTSVALHMSFQRYFWLLLAMAGAAAFVALREARAMGLTDDRQPHAAAGRH